MNGFVFQEFLTWFKQQVGERKVLLLVDGYTTVLVSNSG